MKSIRVQPTILAHIALSIALAGLGKLPSAKQEFNRVFLLREPKNECFLMLIKSIIILVAGGHDEAMSRVTDLVEACAETDKIICRTVQAQMRVLLGKTALSKQDYEKALKSFASAGALAPFQKFPELETISLMFGWDFNLLTIVIRQQTCEALYGASRISEAIGSLRTLLNEHGAEMKASLKLSDWLENFARRCVTAVESASGVAVARGEVVDPPHSELTPTEQQRHSQHVGSQHGIDNLVQILEAHEQKARCEVLYAEGRTIDAAASFLEITKSVSEEVRTNRSIIEWFTAFGSKCTSTLETIGDEALSTGGYDEAMTAYSTAVLLSPGTPETILAKWARTTLTHSSLDETFAAAAAKFNLPSFAIRQSICDVLEQDGRISEAIRYFQQSRSENREGIDHGEGVQWEHSFQRRCAERLEKLGDAAMDFGSYDEAIKHFSEMLSLELPDCMEVFIKRSKAYASMSSWEEALSDADEAIKADPKSHQGYERRHAALHGAKRYAGAVEAFRTMLLKLDESPDEHLRKLRSQYVDASSTIQHIVQQTVHDMPRVLIDTTTGRLHDKAQQATAIESLPVYNELVSSMTRRLDHARIRREAKEFYRYVMLSHRWEYDEPLLRKVESVSVYKLEASPANSKLQMFCSLARTLGFRWAWSDTCCINKADLIVLQESLVAMFTWYRGSSLTVVHLRGVRSESQMPEDLQRSIWNTRAWTYQEYVAAETVVFYTEDWKPYLGLTLANHKESPDIIAEMQQVTGLSAQEMAVLSPGLDRVREKLYAVSMRQTTLVGDAAYSLLGIFNVAIPVIYGEGNRAVGRLLEQVLASSGDVTILAWTGRAGTYNSCLPVDLTAYGQLVPPHIPQPIDKDEMVKRVTILRSSLTDPTLAVMLHDQLSGLPPVTLTSSRLRLPSIAFRLAEFDHISGPDPVTNIYTYRASTSALGDVEIQTTDNLIGMKDLRLVHPWIHPLLDQEFPDDAAMFDKTTQALRLIARLRQPFGALLLGPLSHVVYQRVATDSLIMVRVREDVSLTELMDNIRTTEIL